VPFHVSVFCALAPRRFQRPEDKYVKKKKEEKKKTVRKRNIPTERPPLSAT
jgi:hypothetical protein